MAKVDFKLNDSLLRRKHAAGHGTVTQRPTGPANPDELPETPALAPTATEAPRRLRESRKPPTASKPSTMPPDRGSPRRSLGTIQTSVLLPPTVWDQLASLAREAGGLATTHRLLVDVLEAYAPRSLEQAAGDLDRLLLLPADESGLGAPWEERNVRLPLDLRQRLDELRRTLTAAGVAQATRAHLVAATVLLRGPRTADEARKLMADRRAESFRRALAVQAG